MLIYCTNKAQYRVFLILLVPTIKIQRLNFKFFSLLLQSAESGKKKTVGIHQAFLLLFSLSLTRGVEEKENLEGSQSRKGEIYLIHLKNLYYPR